jgi:hypothetical protein
MRILALLAAALMTSACSVAATSPEAGDEADITADAATLKLTRDYRTTLVGAPAVGKGIVIEYALERLPQCRGNVGGGGPGWNVTGYYSENGGAARAFEVTTLTPDGKDRVAKAGRIVPAAGGDVAIWFQVASRFGCSEYDSQYGQNYHVAVKGSVPDAQGSIVFGKDGRVSQSGRLVAGGKVKVRYEQPRLPDCRRTERGNPVWTITGFSQIDREATRTFDTAVPEGADRREIDAIVDLPHAGELSLWFQVTSLGGCMRYDSAGGANYRFRIGE